MGVVGAGLLIASGAIHLDLYLTGYRSIPTIGWLFLLQVITAFGLAVVILVTASRPASAAGALFALASAAGALFALATLGGYLLSLRVSLFGFREVRTTAGIVAGLIEVAAFLVLALAATPSALGRRALAAVAGVCLAALVLLGVAFGLAGNGQQPVTAGQVLRTTKIDGVAVLTNTKGLTLYWFAPDTQSASRCTGTCASYWPPVYGTPAAGPGVTGKLGTIRRPDGTTQATYDGHPLYTYVGDSAPGQAGGNNLNLNGGLWHEVTVSSGSG